MAEKKLKTVNIKGKQYVMVNERVRAFREEPKFKGFTIETTIHELTPDTCTMCARILNAEGRVVSTGWAREVRTDKNSMVNSTSYVENCETSAVGRALGYLGIGIDDAICSAEELAMAITAKNEQERELTEREQEELDEAYSYCDAATDKDALMRIYNRYQDAAFAPLLVAHCKMICRQNGWPTK